MIQEAEDIIGDSIDSEKAKEMADKAAKAMGYGSYEEMVKAQEKK